MRKNTASQVVGVQMITSADGTAFTGTVTAVITVDGGTQSASGGTGPTHEGNGFHTYLPTQAETNGDHIGFTFTGTGAIPATVQVYANFPQTVDNNVLAAGATGFAAIDAVADAILADTAEIGAAGAGLTDLGGMSTAMKAEAKTEAAGALTDYDAPTNTEMVAAFTEIKGASWATTDSLEAIRDHASTIKTAADAVKAKTDNLPSDPADQSLIIAATDAIVSQGNSAWATATGFATPTNITAGTITTVSGNVNGGVSGAVGSVAGLTASDVGAIKTVTDALPDAGALTTIDGIADQLNLGIIYGAAQTGTLSTTVATSDLTGYADDQLIGRVIIFTSGPCDGEATDITDYASAGGTLTFTALTTAPANGNTFKIV